ncbi:prephenate dehydratase [Schlesneria paludicola]|uniref:prephenate dehydratase n=1 Tax=Schlesneria paludicola TaxID=360056 RepID=UPI00029A9546|nr:prephenate dehydratase [Schlesneria paludicola]
MASKPVPKKPVKSNTAPASAKAPTNTAAKASAGSAQEMARLDNEILKLLNRRAAATAKLIEADPNWWSATYDPRSDDDLLKRIESENQGPLPADAVRGVFRQVLSAVRNRVRPRRVSYLGPAFSFTHMAAVERFGESSDLIPVNTIAAVFEEVNRGHADFGVVPIENSTDGRIIDTLDMFTRLPLRICGEIQLCIHHNLLGKVSRGEINEVYSKPQALSQCRDWLSRNMPQARLIEVTSTSTAAQLARDKPGAGAIASKQAAVEYGLQILADSVEDNKNNVTRFAMIGDKPIGPTGRDRTSLLLQIGDKPGALADALASFKQNKINLTWIESFPLRGPESGYIFFIDCEGHSKDAKVKRTLDDLARLAVRMEVLGSYPRSELIG